MDITASSSRASDAPERSVEYRQRAAECRALAYELCNDGARKELLDLAEVWTSLADTAAPFAVAQTSSGVDRRL